MIKITVYKDSKSDYRGFEVSGHAGYAEAGQDIICAAVSVLTINTINAIERFTDDAFTTESCEENAEISLTFTDSISKESTLLMDSMVLGLQELEDDNNEEYIDLIFEEV
jgi:uncharacterized protein YsxB (DUF464 family)